MLSRTVSESCPTAILFLLISVSIFFSLNVFLFYILLILTEPFMNIQGILWVVVLLISLLITAVTLMFWSRVVKYQDYQENTE